MFIQLKDLDLQHGPKNQSVFILQTQSVSPLYISRSFADHDIHKYTTTKLDYALIYFNRQSAVQAMSTAFGYTGLPLIITRKPINEAIKIAAQKSDAIRKFAKNEARRKRVPHPWN